MCLTPDTRKFETSNIISYSLSYVHHPSDNNSIDTSFIKMGLSSSLGAALELGTKNINTKSN